jgi:GTP cyclohydrolase II
MGSHESGDGNAPKTKAKKEKKLARYGETLLPTSHGDLRCIVYRTPAGVEHVAMVAGDPRGQEDLLCRIHSECLTSEVFGSTKCDCKLQLDLALDTIAHRGAGVVLYMRQEGRGIGLGNKIRAYALQEQGHDTVDANRLLGLPDDARDYTPAAEMLADLGVKSVALMTNNPLKVDGLRAAGAEVARRVAHVTPAPANAVAYLEAKRDRMGHHLGDDINDDARQRPRRRFTDKKPHLRLASSSDD